MPDGLRSLDFHEGGESRREALFYLVGHFHDGDGYYPLAVVAQTPPCDNRWMRLDDMLIRNKIARVCEFLTDPRHRCAMEAEMDAAVHMYHAGAAGLLVNRPEPPGVMTASARRALLRDPKHTPFPYLTRGLLRCVKEGGRGHKSSEESARYWSQVPLNTTFLERGDRYTVVVFDITQLDSIRCGIFITADSSKLDGPSGTSQLEALLMDFEDYDKYASNVNEGDMAPVPVDFTGYAVDRDAIANMLWDQYRSEKLKPRRNKARIRSLTDYSITSLVKSTEYVSKFDPLALGDVRVLPRFADDLFDGLLRNAPTGVAQPQAMAQLLIPALEDRPDVGISQLRGLSCDALAMALAAPELQNIRTLSIATDVLTRGGVPALIEALRSLPNLETVYLADMQGEAPTEESRRTVARQQVAFVQAMLAMGETALRKKIFCSASYASALEGEPILDGNM